VPQAVEQLELAQKSGDGNFYEQSQVDARLREMKKRMLDEAKQAKEKKDKEERDMILRILELEKDEKEKLLELYAVINKGEILVNEPMKTLLERHGGEEKLEDIYLGLIGAEKEAKQS
jgi:hypothetical protein